MEFYHSNKVEAIVFHDIPICETNCPGCYLKPHVKTWKNLTISQQNKSRSLVRKAYSALVDKETLQCNQLVYAANNDIGVRNILSMLQRETDNIKLQVLANKDTWNTIWSQAKAASVTTQDYYTRQMSKIQKAISIDENKTIFNQFSLREQVDKLIEQKYDIINLLWTPITEKSYQTIGFESEKTILYLMLYKPIHGEKPTKIQISLGQKLLKYYHRVKNSSNIQLDYCLNHIVNESGGCRAGVNMFNVHASGMITGCPYSAKAKTWLQDHHNIGKAIKYVRELANSNQDYDWNNCKLRKISW